MKEEEAALRDQQLSVNQNRHQIYAFLSRMYEREITLDLLKELTSESSPVLRISDSELSGDKGFRKGFELLRKYLVNASGRDLNQVKLELAVDYANLFLGVKGKPLHPSESVYRSKDHSMFQEYRDEVLFAYWKAHVDRVKEYTEPEDHIAIELQFMEYLCRKAVEAQEKNKKDEVRKYLLIQRGFVNDHLAKWVPQLTKDILESADVDFYKGIAYLTSAFIELEKKTTWDFLEE